MPRFKLSVVSTATLQAELQPLRLAFEKGLSLGGRFTALAEEDRQKIRQLFSSAP